MIGLAYEAAARLTREPSTAKDYRDRAVEVYRELLRRDRADAQAMLALAVATDDRSERIRLLKEGIALAPHEMYAIKLLASELTQEGGEEATLEAARYMESAYVQRTGRYKWHLASMTYQLYQLAGATERAAQFRGRVRNDLRVRDLQHPLGDVDPKEISGTLSSLCDHNVIPIIGAKECVSSIGTIVEHATAGARNAKSQQLANAASDAIVEAVDARKVLDQERADWQQTFQRWLEGLHASGHESSSTQYAYATLATGQKRLTALQRAAQLAPNSGQAAFRLGLEYAQHAMWNEAEVQLGKAKKLLPDNQQSAVDYHLEAVAKRTAENRKAGVSP